ncbi:MAG TPA: hypothetical protein VHR16_07270 [Candidatus Limnocylindrales bacterium]|jgi:hypothetical protein|nr:hypothetical protein [Candidatus Limnocylindrales bacterium]
MVGARTFGYSFPDEAERGALPVLVTDHAGAVVSIDAAPVGLRPIADDGFMPVPGAPNALVIHWTGGDCDSKVDIDVQGSGGDLNFSLATTVRPVPCDAVGVPRSILVTLAAPLDPSRTSLVVVKP